jgi:hypothetical protein
MNKSIKILTIALLLSGSISAEETSIGVAEAEVATKTQDTKNLEAKIRIAVKKVLSSQNEVKFSEEQIAILVKKCAKDLQNETEENRNKAIANIDTVSFTATLDTPVDATDTKSA